MYDPEKLQANIILQLNTDKKLPTHRKQPYAKQTKTL